MMSNLHCNGMESTILSCDQHPNMYGVLRCSHHQDAGVICEGGQLNFSMSMSWLCDLLAVQLS